MSPWGTSDFIASQHEHLGDHAGSPARASALRSRALSSFRFQANPPSIYAVIESLGRNVRLRVRPVPRRFARLRQHGKRQAKDNVPNAREPSLPRQ